MNAVRVMVFCSLVALATAADAGQWSYTPETGRLRHDESGWIFRAEAHGRELEITGRTAAPTPHLPLADPVEDGYAITRISGGLNQNRILQTLVLPDTLAHFEPFQGLAWECNNLIRVDLGRIPSANLEFPGCLKLSEIIVHPDNPAYKNVDGVVFTQDGKTLVRCPPALKQGRYMVPANVVHIEHAAFWGCRGLTEIILPDTVEQIDWGAFSGCTKLEQLALPDALQRISNDLFMDCGSLRRVAFPARLAPDGLGSQAFRGCIRLDNVFLPEGLTRPGLAAFMDCRALRHIRLPATMTHLSPSGDESGWAPPFAGCVSLEMLALPRLIEPDGLGIFPGCDALVRFTVEAGHGTMRSDGGVIYSADGLTLIRCPPGLHGSFMIPEGTREVRDFAFAHCRKLTDVRFPAGLQKIGQMAFWKCDALQGINFPDSVREIGRDAFAECRALQTVKLPPALVETSVQFLPAMGAARRTDDRTGAVRFSEDGATLLRYPPGSPGTTYVVPDGTKAIGDEAFFYTKTLEQVIVPDSVTAIGRGAFELSEKLAFVRLPPDLKIIPDDLFYACPRLTHADLPTAPETVGESAFFRANLAFETLPDSIRNIGGHAYAEVRTASTLRLPAALERMGEAAFEGAPELEHVIVPGGVQAIGHRVFASCPKLKSLIFNGAYPQTIGEGVLDGSRCATTYVARAFGASWEADVSFGPIGATNSIWQGRPIIYVGARTRPQVPLRKTETSERVPGGLSPDRTDALSPTVTAVIGSAVDADGDGMSDADEAVAGTDPANPDSFFRALILVKDGTVVIHWDPDLGDKRVYTIEGKVSLGDRTWQSPPAPGCRFFRVIVDWPPGVMR